MTSHFASLLNKTNIFRVVVDLYSNRSQKTSKCVKKINDKTAMPHVPLLCSFLVLMLCVIYYWTEALQHGVHF